MDFLSGVFSLNGDDDPEEEINFANCSSPGPSSIVASHSNTSQAATPTTIMVSNVDSQDFCNDYFQRTSQPHSGLTQIVEETADAFFHQRADGSQMTWLRRQTSFKQTPEAVKQGQQRFTNLNESPLSRRRSAAIFTDFINEPPVALSQDLQNSGFQLVNTQRFDNLPPQVSAYGTDAGFYDRVNRSIMLTCEKYKESITHPRYLFDTKKNTLFIMPGHSVAIYLGQGLAELAGATVRTYVVYDDDASRQKLVTTCAKHTKPQTDMWHRYYLKSDDASVIRHQNSPADPLSIIFPTAYHRQPPAISVSFDCNNSCLGRRKLRLCVDVDLHNMHWSRSIQLRVCSNPGRDAQVRATDDVSERFKYFKESMPVQKRSNVMKNSFLRNAKRQQTQDLREPSAPEEETEDEATKVYTLYVCGKANYTQLLRQAQLLSVEERHYCSSKRTSGLRSTQIDETSSVCHWLELMDKGILIDHFNKNEIETMSDLLERYNTTFFKTIGIPAADIPTLDICFTNWMHVTLCNRL
uniref:P53 domain-containing protein n=1 Tax=Panagrellus redivivus TaxID=6233 RepID=A0A7E4WCU7_PANRE